MPRRFVCSTLVAMLIGAFLAVVPVPAGQARATDPLPTSTSTSTSTSTFMSAPAPTATSTSTSTSTTTSTPEDTTDGTSPVPSSRSTATVDSDAPVFVRAWGTGGAGNSQFSAPSGLAIDVAYRTGGNTPTGNVYVADTRNHRIQAFTATGTYLTQWGTNGTGTGQFRYPEGVAVGWDGQVYVTDGGAAANVVNFNGRVQKFDSTGTFLSQWGSLGMSPGQTIAEWMPRGVAIDGNFNLYVADTYRGVIQKFSILDAFQTQWGSLGDSPGQLYDPAGVAVDADRNVYVADEHNNRVEKYTSTGTYLTQWGATGAGAGQFDGPRGVAVAADGHVYVADSGNDRIQEFTTTGTYLGQWGTTGSGNGQFDDPRAVAADRAGNLYVADSGNNRIQEFSLDRTAPTVDLRTPSDGQTLDRDATVVADYSCTDGSGIATGIATCTGTVAFGDPIDTTTLGDHTFTVAATDNVGNTATVTHHYTVVRTSRLAGTVTESGTGGPLEGTWVVALRTEDYRLAGGAPTGADGRYSLRVDPGSYVIEFLDPALSHVIEWYDGHGYRDIAGADPVATTAGATTTVDADLQDPTGTVSGNVNEAGTWTPLTGAVVAVLPVGVARPLAATTTDANGDFRIDRLPPGDYVVVSATPQGTHLANFYGGTTDVDVATHVTVTAGATRPDLYLHLPAVTGAPVVGSVTGAVTDEITGQTEPGTFVGALRAADYRFTAATFTDQDGGYRLGVGGGEYYLEIFDLDTGHEFEWYDDQHTPGQWNQLTTVFTSATADAALTPLEGNVAGTVTEAGTATPLAGVWVALIGYDTGQPVAGTVTDTDGRYTIPAIDIGDYYEVFIDPTGDHALEFHNDTTDMGAATPVTVTGGHTTAVDAALAPHV